MLVLVLLVIITVMLLRRRRAGAAQAKKLARLASRNEDGQKVKGSNNLKNKCTMDKTVQDRILSILDSRDKAGKKTVETGHVKVMKKYSVKNTRYHKTSPVLNT